MGARSLSQYLSAPFDYRHYRASTKSFSVYQHPVVELKNYLTGSGKYPRTCVVRTPSGLINLHLHSHHDLLTVNEIFCRGDYETSATPRVVVDIGSNIGISAAYFLSRSPDCFAYLFEPVDFNLNRLRENLTPFDGRYAIEGKAIGLARGIVRFGIEPSGRYGGINVIPENSIDIECLDVVDIIDQVLDKHDYIDILKIDVEGLEMALVERMRPDQSRRIRTILIEAYPDRILLGGTHAYRQYGCIARYEIVT